MAPLRRVLLGLSSVSPLVLASPIKEDVVGRANALCSIENPIVHALGAQHSATTFCSSYLAIPTQTFHATVTATTSTSTTATITTGTEIDTAATSTVTDISTTTTTLTTTTTSDDTSPTPVKRAIKPVAAISSLLAKLEAPFLSSACSCLSVPTPSTTITQTVTSTVSLTSTTSTFATTTTYTPVVETSTTATDTATSTQVILKSDVLASIAAIVSQDSYQAFCSDILGYTTPLTTVYQTVTSTASATESVTTTQTKIVATLTTSVLPAKRQVDSDPTPTPLASYPADYVMSGCLLAVTSPGTSTISSTLTATTTQTTTQTATQVILATATATTTLVEYPLSNGGFESGSLAPWTVVQPISGQGGAWTVEASPDAPQGSNVAQLVMLNPDRTKYGSFASWISQGFPTYAGHTYTLSFYYSCPQISTTSYINPQVPGNASVHLTCAAASTWYTASVSWTAASASGTVALVGIQNGLTQAVYQFDSVAVTLNN